MQNNGFGHDQLLEIIKKLLKAEEEIIMDAMKHFNITMADAPHRVYVLDERIRKTYYMDGVPAIIVNRDINLEDGKASLTYHELYR